MAIGDSFSKSSYFLVAVSTRENLELCIKHALAGFLSGENGAWTFSEIQAGDFVSFLYGARAHNLYKVARKEAILCQEELPPWKPLSFKKGGKVYNFPFRLYLEPVRRFIEPIMRTEFFYVAENLLLRGGYKKTHFQADQTTLQNVSEMGVLDTNPGQSLQLPAHTLFVPRFTQNPRLVKPPEVFSFQEPILQSALRRYLTADTHLDLLLSHFSKLDMRAESLEVLGEKAITRGHIDLLVKQRTPKGISLKVPIEVKTKRAGPDAVLQVRCYMDELGSEAPAGILIAAGFAKKTIAAAQNHSVSLARYALAEDLNRALTFEEIHQSLSLQVL